MRSTSPRSRRRFLALAGGLAATTVTPGCNGIDAPLPDSKENDRPPEQLPAFVTHGVIDLDRITAVSKFRSAYGHSYAFASEETCRSMKHYFMPYGVEPGIDHDPPWSTIQYYAPTDGWIADVTRKESHGVQEARFQIVPDEYPSALFRFFHVDLRDDLDVDSEVTAGEAIGTVAHEYTYGEIAVERHYEIDGESHSAHVPWSRVVDDSVFQRYRDRGVESRDALVISREERTSEPLVCVDDGTGSGEFRGRVGVTESPESYSEWSTGAENFVMLDDPA